MSEEISKYIKDEIRKIDEELFELQHSIWENPELKYEEFHAHKVLTAYMSKQPGWEVTPHAFGIETSFVAVFKHKSELNKTVISFNSEYDALPGIGHACGHNLIAVVGVSAAIATALAMTKFDICGTVKLLGTPAEESEGGKIRLIDAGAYKDCDVSLMAHPGNGKNRAVIRTTAIQRLELEFFGREAHAAASPWEGINALDAMMVTYNAVSMLRQQILPSDIVQCNISEGGLACNIITAYTAATFGIRSKTRGRLQVLLSKVENCIKAGALATGCKYKINYNTNYYNMITNEWLARIYSDKIKLAYGEELDSYETQFANADVGASSDEGNVSWEIPSLQSSFFVDAGCSPHNPGFTKAAGTRKSHASAISTGITLSLTGLELLMNDKMLKKVKASFAEDLKQSALKPGEIVQIEKLDQLIAA